MYVLFYRHVIEKRLGLANPDKNLNVTFVLLSHHYSIRLGPSVSLKYKFCLCDIILTYCF